MREAAALVIGALPFDIVFSLGNVFAIPAGITTLRLASVKGTNGDNEYKRAAN